MSIGSNIRSLREERGLTQEQVADKIGITFQAVSSWERDEYKPDLDKLLKLAEVFYFEVVDDRSFLYTQAAVFEAKEKLYEFERLCAGSTLFRCSKSMILNAEKIDYVRPSLSGRFEAVLSNGEKAVVSRKYVADLKRMLGV